MPAKSIPDPAPTPGSLEEVGYRLLVPQTADGVGGGRPQGMVGRRQKAYGQNETGGGGEKPEGNRSPVAEILKPPVTVSSFPSCDREDLISLSNRATVSAIRFRKRRLFAKCDSFSGITSW